MSVKEERMSDADDVVYSERTIKREPMPTECEDQCSYTLIKVETEDDTDALSTHGRKLLEFELKREELCEEEQIVDKRESSDTDVPVKVEIEIGPTVIQPQYIGSSLHTTDASKAELIQCGGADVALGTTTPGAVSFCGNSTRSRSVVHGGISGRITVKDIRTLMGNQFKSTTRTHVVRHIIGGFSCNFCEYKCKHKSSLVAHMRIHTRDRPFSCNICEYKCVVKSNLERHMHTHTGDKPFSCINCDYKCVAKSNLVIHMRTHTGEKPFSCNVCEYKCVVKSNLVTHMRTHTGEKPYSCNICEYKCKVKSSLVRHMRTRVGH